jgi:hypothetical protein
MIVMIFCFLMVHPFLPSPNRQVWLIHPSKVHEWMITPINTWFFAVQMGGIAVIGNRGIKDPFSRGSQFGYKHFPERALECAG